MNKLQRMQQKSQLICEVCHNPRCRTALYNLSLSLQTTFPLTNTRQKQRLLVLKGKDKYQEKDRKFVTTPDAEQLHLI